MVVFLRMEHFEKHSGNVRESRPTSQLTAPLFPLAIKRTWMGFVESWSSIY